MKKLFNVSTKAAIFDQTNEHVLAIHMDRTDNWGLPGGHIEEGETPDDAMSRELLEECGIKPDSLQHKDFFVHSGGKIVLACVGTVSDTTLKSQQNDLEGIPKWLSLSEFEAIQIEPNYRNFVLENWPK